MFTITVQSGFSARHGLVFANGEKEAVHGHDWVVKAAVSRDGLDESGLAIDFIELKAKIDGITAEFGDSELEELACFAGRNASAENIAKYIYEKLEPVLPSEVKLVYVELMEAAGCWAKYCG